MVELLAFDRFPPQAAVALLAMFPFGELRMAIPVGVAAFKMPVAEAFLWAEVGNAVPVAAIYGLAGWWLRAEERKRGFLHRLADRVTGRSHFLASKEIGLLGLAALAAFVAVPLPGSGAWTAAAAAFVLGIPFRRAFPAIVIGNIGAGLIMALAVSGAVTALRVFL